MIMGARPVRRAAGTTAVVAKRGKLDRRLAVGLRGLSAKLRTKHKRQARRKAEAEKKKGRRSKGAERKDPKAGRAADPQTPARPPPRPNQRTTTDARVTADNSRLDQKWAAGGIFKRFTTAWISEIRRSLMGWN